MHKKWALEVIRLGMEQVAEEDAAENAVSAVPELEIDWSLPLDLLLLDPLVSLGISGGI